MQMLLFRPKAVTALCPSFAVEPLFIVFLRSALFSLSLFHCRGARKYATALELLSNGDLWVQRRPLEEALSPRGSQRRTPL